MDGVRHPLGGAILAVSAICMLGSSALGPEWRDARDGDWRFTGDSHREIRQSIPDVRADLFQRIPRSQGACFRTYVELSPAGYRAGLWVGISENPANWLLLALDGQHEGRGFALLDSAGSTLWEDPWVQWTYYTPYLIECVLEPGRARVQMFGWNGVTLLSQSDWVALPRYDEGEEWIFGLHTDRAIARFQGWEVADQPTSPIVPGAPNKLRLVQQHDSEWSVVGPGNWMWSSPERVELRQTAQVERTTAVYSGVEQLDGVWRCQATVDPNAGGAGLLFRTDETASKGFSAWLGGTPGAGALMLYSLDPLKALWSSEQGVWQFDTVYTIEARVENGTARARLLSEDGARELAGSPAFAMAELGAALGNFSGVQTWKGTARFRGIRVGSDLEGDRPMAAQMPDQPPGWQIVAGNWNWPETSERPTVIGDGTAEAARALCDRVSGARGVWSATVTPGPNAESAALWFQVNPALTGGFILRLEDSEAALLTVGGRVLWQTTSEHPLSNATYTLEGIVATDRVRVRVLDASRQPLVESSDCYVSDTNNDRTGILGLEVVGGTATFSEWSSRETE